MSTDANSTATALITRLLEAGAKRRGPSHRRVIAHQLAQRDPLLDEFTNGYLEGLLWASNDDLGNSLSGNFSTSDFHPETLENLRRTAAQFFNQHENLLEGTDLRHMGINLWLSQNGHGTGFFDDNTLSDEQQELLHAAAKGLGERYTSIIPGANGLDQIYVD